MSFFETLSKNLPLQNTFKWMLNSLYCTKNPSHYNSDQTASPILILHNHFYKTQLPLFPVGPNSKPNRTIQIAIQQ